MNRLKNYSPYLIIYITTIATLLPGIGLLVRFPWQDLIYADFQIYNRWRWFAESIHESGLFNTILSPIDFRLNTGENLYISSRVSAPIFDIGAWFYVLTHSLDLALRIKFIFYSLFSFFGVKSLLKVSSLKFEFRKLIIFSVVFVSLVSHPNFFHEVGPMVFWYLLLTPNWFSIYEKVISERFKSALKSPLFYVLLVLTIGSSDLFIFFYFATVGVFFAGLKAFNKQNLMKIFLLTCFIEFIMILSKFTYLIYSMQPFFLTRKGTTDLIWYIFFFVIPTLKFAILTPHFTGPLTLFLNIVVLMIFVYTLVKSWQNNKKYLFMALFLLFMLFDMGAIFHGIPYFQERLPSAFRYQLAVWPAFTILMLVYFDFSKILKTIKFKPKIRAIFASAIGLVFVLLVFFTPKIYNPIIPAASKHTIDSQFRNWIVRDLPACITTSINSSEFRNRPKQYIFATSTKDEGRNDALTVLIENPIALDGRTFIQWRYGTDLANYNLNTQNGLDGFNTYGFTSLSTDQMIRFGMVSTADFILSTDEIRDNRFAHIGSCSLPNGLVGHATPFKSIRTDNLLGNHSLNSRVFIYAFQKSTSEAFKSINFSSSKIHLTATFNGAASLVLPLNYSRDLQIEINNEKVTVKPNEINLATVFIPKEQQMLDNKLGIQVSQHSGLLIFDIFLLLIMIFVAIILSASRIYRVYLK